MVVPVKPAAVGKSRLDVPGVARADLARAIALDTIAAVAAASRVAEVIVVTADGHLRDELAGWTRAASARIVAAAEDAPAGLDAAIRTGLALCSGDRAVLLGDLPALRAADVDAALARAAEVERGLVPDAEGTGTTLVTARSGVPLEPAFGADSAARHRAAGFTDLGIDETSALRRDVDTAAQLHAARARLLGPRTSALLR